MAKGLQRSDGLSLWEVVNKKVEANVPVRDNYGIQQFFAMSSFISTKPELGCKVLLWLSRYVGKFDIYSVSLVNLLLETLDKPDTFILELTKTYS